MSITDFNSKLATIQSKHKMSDACVADVLLLMASVLPLPNKCPSIHAYKAVLRPDDLPFTIPVTSGVCYGLPFNEIVARILARYPYVLQFQLKSTDRRLNDITDGRAFPKVQPDVLYFMVNTDGISPIRSRHLHVWPVILSLINLKLSQRRLLQNLVLVSLYIGETQPIWSEVLLHLVTQIQSGVNFKGKHYKCEVVCLVADMPAKSSICNIQHPTAK